MRVPLVSRHPVLLLLTAGLAACGGDDSASDIQADSSVTGDSQQSSPPTATFTSPADNTLVEAGAPITLSGQVNDDRDAAPDLTVTWRSSLLSGPLGQSTPTSTGHVALELPELVIGTHVITLEAIDGHGGVGTDTLTLIVNGPPSAPVVTITPANPTTADNLVASVTTPSTDPNRTSDQLRYDFVWMKDGALADLRTATVPAAATTRGEVWEVRVTANDGLLAGPLATARVTIANAVPTCPAATLLPSAGTVGSTFTCACPGYDDLDPEDTDQSTCTFLDGDAVVGPDDGSCTLAPGAVTRGMSLRCRLTPHDGLDAGAAVESPSVSVLNAKPTAPVAGLTPSAGTVVDEYACVTLTPSTDADGDPLTYPVSWLVNGVEDPDVHAGVTLAKALQRDAAGTPPRRGDTLRCRLRASDGADTSSPADSPELVLGNAAPVLENVLVQPESGTTATAASTLVCNTAGALDPDADPLTTTYAWFIDGVVVPGETGRTLSGHFTRNVKVTCQASVTDGLASSTPAASKNTVVIANALPTLTEVSTTPATTSSGGGEVTCLWSGWSDADGDAAEVAITWYADGTEVPGEHGATLDTTSLAPGVEVTCAATPKNGSELGDPVVSDNATIIVNAPPTLAGVTLGPDSPTVDATLTCTPQGFADSDGDSPSYVYAWTRDGETLAGATAATLSGAFEEGDTLRCRVTPNDGFADGAPVLSPPVVIANSPPTVGAVRVDPAGGAPCRVYGCVVEGGADRDAGDLVSYAYRWLKNGAEVAGQTSATYSGALADGDTLACAAKPTDGTTSAGALVYGAEKVSTPVAIDDAPPVLGAVTLTPEAPGVGALLTCAASATSDDCATAISTTYQWYVDGTVVEGAIGATFDTTDLELGDQVRCQATPGDGLDAGAPKTSPTVALGPGSPTAAEVEVRAPEGPAGPVTCAITKDARWFTNPRYDYYWSINGADEFQDAATLSAARADCDLLACRVVVTDAVASLSSKIETYQLPLVDGCEDGNDCSSHFCRPEGGCGVVLEDGIFCEDGDPCSPTGVCDQGACVALGNVCHEEPVNLDRVTYAANSTQVDLAGFADGRHVATWHFAPQNLSVARMTASDDSRRDEEVALTPVPAYVNKRSAVAVSPQNEVLLIEVADTAVITAHRRSGDDLGVALAPPLRVLDNPTVNLGCFSYGLSTFYTEGFPLYVGNVPMVAVANAEMSQQFCSGGGAWPPYATDLKLVPMTGDYAASRFTLVSGAERDLTGITAAAIPGTSTIVSAWLKGGTTLKARVSDFVSGVVSVRATVDVETGANAIQQLAVAGLADGGFVVAWSRANGANGVDIFYRRYDGDGVPVGAAVLANSKVAGDQVLGDIATFSDNGVVVSYTDPGTGQGTDVFARTFDDTDTAEGDAFDLALYSTAANQHGPKLAVFGDDGWVASWIDESRLINGELHVQVMTRRFFREGDPDPGVRARPVPSLTAGDQTNPAVAVTPDDRVMVVYEAGLFPGLGTEIQRRLFDKNGKPLELDATVNTTIDGVQKAPAVTASAGRFVVAWESSGQDGDGAGVYLQRFDKLGGAVGEETQVNTTTAGAQTGPALASRADGVVLVVWTGREPGAATTDIYGKVYDASGVVLMPETVLNKFRTGNQSAPAITVTKDGHFIVAWQSRDEVAGGGLDVFMRKLSVTQAADGSKTFTLAASAFRANEISDGDQQAPSLSISKGTIAYLTVCWESLGPTTIGRDIRCQVFNDNANGFSISRAEFSPVANAEGTQQKPKVTHVSTGQLVVSWETGGLDFSGSAIHFTRLPAAGPAVLLPRYVANRYPFGDQTRAALSPLWSDAGRVLIVWQSDGEDGSGQGIMMRAPYPL